MPGATLAFLMEVCRAPVYSGCFHRYEMLFFFRVTGTIVMSCSIFLIVVHQLGGKQVIPSVSLPRLPAVTGLSHRLRTVADQLRGAPWTSRLPPATVLTLVPPAALLPAGRSPSLGPTAPVPAECRLLELIQNESLLRSSMHPLVTTTNIEISFKHCCLFAIVYTCILVPCTFLRSNS